MSGISTFFLVAWVAFGASSSLGCGPQELLREAYVRSGYARELLSNLCAPNARTRAFLSRIRWPSEAPASMARRLDATVGLYRRCSGEPENVVLLVALGERKTNVGFAAFSYGIDGRARLVGELTSFYKDSQRTQRRLSEPMLEAADELVHRSLGLTELRVHADTVGRYVWAVQGFRFRPAIWYYDVDGSVVVLPEMARRNFRRFLERFGLRLRDLIRRTSEGVIPVRFFSELQSPGDYAQLEHKDGRLVTIRPYVLQDETLSPIYDPPTALPVGKAFLLGDRAPAEADRVFIRTSMRAPRTAYFMPDYRGVRPVGP